MHANCILYWSVVNRIKFVQSKYLVYSLYNEDITQILIQYDYLSILILYIYIIIYVYYIYAYII